jgi:hypothetical protein
VAASNEGVAAVKYLPELLEILFHLTPFTRLGQSVAAFVNPGIGTTPDLGIELRFLKSGLVFRFVTNAVLTRIASERQDFASDLDTGLTAFTAAIKSHRLSPVL